MSDRAEARAELVKMFERLAREAGLRWSFSSDMVAALDTLYGETSESAPSLQDLETAAGRTENARLRRERDALQKRVAELEKVREINYRAAVVNAQRGDKWRERAEKAEAASEGLERERAAYKSEWNRLREDISTVRMEREGLTMERDALKARVAELEAALPDVGETVQAVVEVGAEWQRIEAEAEKWQAYAKRLEVAIQRVDWSNSHSHAADVAIVIRAALREIERGPGGEQPEPDCTQCGGHDAQCNHDGGVACEGCDPDDLFDLCVSEKARNEIGDAPEPPSEEAIRAACEAGRKHAKAACEEMRGQPGPPSGQRYTGPTCIRCGVHEVPEEGDDVCPRCEDDDAPEETVGEPEESLEDLWRRAKEKFGDNPRVWEKHGMFYAARVWQGERAEVYVTGPTIRAALLALLAKLEDKDDG